jgi:hypothetical protein
MRNNRPIKVQMVNDEGELQGVIINPTGLEHRSVMWTQTEWTEVFDAAMLKLAKKLAEEGDFMRASICLELRAIANDPSRRTDLELFPEEQTDLS